ncbi:uncharacterized protein [Haliotis cracherodii]|uniref:uncharacterized protein n=1 Tax=Haliotis cracherodii TaxID=6455 RepID=UPI0039ECB20A
MKVFFLCVVAVVFGVVARAQSPATNATTVDAQTSATVPQGNPATNTHVPQGNPSTNIPNYHMMNTQGYPTTNPHAPYGFPVMNTQGYPMANTQGYLMANTQGYPMTNNPVYPMTIGNSMPTNNGYRGNILPANNHYQALGNTNNVNSYMLPMMMGMDQGRHMATLGMMMNSRQGNNMLPFYMMNQGYENMLPMMAFMNSGTQRGQRMNPFMMMTLSEAMN